MAQKNTIRILQRHRKLSDWDEYQLWHWNDWILMLSVQYTLSMIFQPFFLSFHSFFNSAWRTSFWQARVADRFCLAVHEWGRQMEHARQSFVDLSRLYNGRKWGWMWTVRAGERGKHRMLAGQLSGQDSKGWRGECCPSTVVLLVELIRFYLSTLLCVLQFWRLRRKASLPSHWTPLHPS